MFNGVFFIFVVLEKYWCKIDDYNGLSKKLSRTYVVVSYADVFSQKSFEPDHLALFVVLFMSCFSVSLFRGMQQCLRRWMLTIHFLKAFSNTPLNTKSNFLATFLFSLVTCFSKTQYSSFVLFLRFLMVKHFTIFFMSQRLYFSLLFVS